MKVHKLEIIAIDFENFGIDDLTTTLEQSADYFLLNVIQAATVDFPNPDEFDSHILNKTGHRKEKLKWFDKQLKTDNYVIKYGLI